MEKKNYYISILITIISNEYNYKHLLFRCLKRISDYKLAHNNTTSLPYSL